MTDIAAPPRAHASRPVAPRPVVLCILDGWGHRAEVANNAIALAQTPVWDRLTAACPYALGDASEHHVGLPGGQMGNSEVGHMTIGAGRIVLQDLPKIDAAVADSSLADRPAFHRFAESLSATGGTAHVMGLMSPGGVHSHQRHIAAVANALAARGIPVAVHAFLDGRDTPPKSAKGFITDFEEAIAGKGPIRIATVSGRYFAMDRDRRWDRTADAHAALAEGKGNLAARAGSAGEAIDLAWQAEETDEFVRPTVVGDYKGMKDGDGVFMANFRADRARQILSALLDPEFDGFARPRTVQFAAALGMSEVSAQHNEWMDTLFPPEAPANVLGDAVAAAGLQQLRIAETEKYAHVTFFLNGGREAPFAGEERILIPSPKVATYDLQPEMSAPELTDRLVAAVGGGAFDLVVVNYANTDMVGHTGDMAAAVRAVEAVDSCLGRLEAAVAAAGGALLITADHGNAEQMTDPETRQNHTAHTRNPVPILLAAGAAGRTLRNGTLVDIAPTVLDLMGLAQPPEMTGASLLGGRAAGSATIAA